MRTLLLFHRYLALGAALFLVVIALSGSALVFEGPIDHALNPQLWRVHDPGTSPLSLDSLSTRVQSAYGTDVVSVSLPPTRELAYVFFTGRMQVYVDPYAATVLGTRTALESNRAFARRLHTLHVTLLGGAVGRAIVGVVCILALVLALSGMCLWWPTKVWRINTGASWKRVNFDLHHATGIVASVVVVIMTASGVLIAYEPLGRFVGKLDGPSAPVRLVVPPPPGGAAPISYDSIVAIARGELPGALVTFVQRPPVAMAPMAIVAMRFPEDRTPGGRSRVFVDAYRGRIVRVESTREAKLGTRINNLKRSLHTGDVLGPVTQVLWCVAAFLLAVQAVTGVLMWWNARAARRAEAARIRRDVPRPRSQRDEPAHA